MKKLFLRFIKNEDLFFKMKNNEKNEDYFKYEEFDFIIDNFSNSNIIKIKFEETVCKQRTNKTRKEFFEDFLIENNIDGMFYQELTEQRKNYINILNAFQLFYIFSSAFSWSLTKQGYKFWSIINAKWMEKYYGVFK